MEDKSYTSTHPLGHTGSVKGSLYLSIIRGTIIIPPRDHTIQVWRSVEANFQKL